MTDSGSCSVPECGFPGVSESCGPSYTAMGLRSYSSRPIRVVSSSPVIVVTPDKTVQLLSIRRPAYREASRTSAGSDHLTIVFCHPLVER